MNDIYDLFLIEIPNSLESEFCDKMVGKFKNDNRKYQGITGKGLDKTIKNTKDLSITNLNDWKEFDSYLFNKLTEGLKTFQNKLKERLKERNIDESIMNSFNIFNNNIDDTGYMIMHYTANEGFYKWHHDGYGGITTHYNKDGGIEYKKECVDKNGKLRIRQYTFLWYLNDVEEGGETYLLHKKVKAEKGKLLLFPANLTYPHKGSLPTSNDKYICTGWIFI